MANEAQSRYSGYGSNLKENNANRNAMRAQRSQREPTIGGSRRGSSLDEYNLMQKYRLRPTRYNPNSAVLSVEEMAALAKEAGYEIDQNGEPVQAGSGRYGDYGSNLEQNNAARNEMRAQRRQRRGGMSQQPVGNAFFSGMEEVGAGPDPATTNATNMGGLIMGAFNPMMSGLAAAPLVAQSPAGGPAPAPQRNSLAQRIREAREMADSERMAVAGQAVAQQRSNQQQMAQAQAQQNQSEFTRPEVGTMTFQSKYGTGSSTMTPRKGQSSLREDSFFQNVANRQGMPNNFATPDQKDEEVRKRVLQNNPSAARAGFGFLSPYTSTGKTRSMSRR